MKDGIIEFYVDKFEYLKNSADSDLDFVPFLARRRMSKLDKVSLGVMNKCMDEDVDYILFSSSNGQVERLLKIIEQYSVFGEVSPAVFSGSVHNYGVGLFLLNCKKTIPYNAISGGENSISSGILSALISDYNNILFCYSDKNEDDYCAFALKICKKSQKRIKKYIIRKKITQKCDNFDEYLKFFSGEIYSLQTYLFELERGKND